jgi:ATP-dependent DNA helicase RecG
LEDKLEIKDEIGRESDHTIGGPIGSPKGGPISSPIQLTGRQAQILNLLKNDPGLTKRRIAALLDVNVSTVQEHLNGLKRLGVIDRVGGKRGFWQIQDPLNLRQGDGEQWEASNTIPVQKPIQSTDEPGIIPHTIPTQKPIQKPIQSTDEPGIIPHTIPHTIGLSEKQSEVLALIQEDPRISIRKMAERLGLNNSTVVEHIDSLKEKGFLERVGKTRGYWKIISKEGA